MKLPRKETIIMSAKINVDQAITDAANIDKVWSQNTSMTLGSDSDPNNPKVTYADFGKAKSALDGFNAQIEATRTQLTKLLDNRDDAAKELSGLNTRALSAIRGIFGPDSAEYDQAGGVRTSARKKPVRKNAATANKAAV